MGHDGLVIAIFGLGLFCGVLIVRYGINVGVRMVYQIKDDVPIFDDADPTEQDFTGDE